jgi:(2Fe-2S) ferredoxin
VRIAKRELLGRKLADRIQLRITGCHGFCEMEPSILIEPQGTFYPKVDFSGMVRIIDAVARRQVVQDLLFVDSGSGTPIERQAEIPFFKKQVEPFFQGMRESIPSESRLY